MSYAKFNDNEAATEITAKLMPFHTVDGVTFYVNEDGYRKVAEAIDNEYQVQNFAYDYNLYRPYALKARIDEDTHVGKCLFPYGVYARLNSSNSWYFIERRGDGINFESMVKFKKRPSDNIASSISHELGEMGTGNAFENIVNKAIKTFGGTTPAAPIEEEQPMTEEKPTTSPLYTQDAFMEMLRKSFVDAIGENLVDEVLPQVKQKVIEEFGFMPERHEVVIADRTNTIDGITHEKFELVCNLVVNDMNPYLFGPAGTGKNVLAQQVAKAIGLDFYTLNSVTDEYKLTGFMDVNGNYIPTEFYKAFTEGGVFFLDEADASAPEVMVALNMAIANKMFPFPTGTRKAHSDFRVIAAGNTLGTGADASYVGRMQLDAATLNRFVVVLVDYDERIDNMSADGDGELVQFSKAYRKVSKKHGINTICSYRNIKAISTMSKFCGLSEALSFALTKDLNRDDVNIIANDPEMPAGNKWLKALKEVKTFV